MMAYKHKIMNFFFLMIMCCTARRHHYKFFQGTSVLQLTLPHLKLDLISVIMILYLMCSIGRGKYASKLDSYGLKVSMVISMMVCQYLWYFSHLQV